ncbi:MAG: MogA/MoaB family molybdenum cofactor biosynthesis protein [Clostridia bacterium]|nr:MogA/MoaB family molybdenum cofactor biosynthesis protein [Clostridia bacterium]
MLISVVCVSDRCSRGEAQDKSGPIISEIMSPLAETEEYIIVPDEIETIKETLKFLCDEKKSSIVFTTGGTGFAPRDVTPEATLSIIDKSVPGIANAIRQKSLEITDMAMLSRATSGIRNQTLIINLPGSPKAVKESLEFIIPVLPHAVEVLSGDTLNCGGDYK